MKLKKNHKDIPLLKVSKWESEEGCYVYVKAYMFMKDLGIVRVLSPRDGSCRYVIREGNKFTYESYVNKGEEYDSSVNHCTEEVYALADKSRDKGVLKFVETL